jgi:hypothetical protein
VKCRSGRRRYRPPCRPPYQYRARLLTGKLATDYPARCCVRICPRLAAWVRYDLAIPLAT